MLATFQRDEQRTRVLTLINASIYLVYFVLVGSTSMLAEICVIVTSITAMYRYRQKKA